MLKHAFDAAVKASPTLKRMLIGQLYRTIAGLARDADLTFMNYGYAPLNGGPPLPLRDDDEPNRYAIQLYHHVAGAVDLAGKTVLEVGSGRGGGASYVARYLEPGSLTGVDRCAEAVEFCAGRHPVPGLAFRHGDAEALPFADASFDVVVNVESSHGYGSLPRFLGEVRRVLRPGGHFLYTDHRGDYEIGEWRAMLLASGLRMLKEEEISANVVRALELDDERKRAMIERRCPRWLQKSIHEFAATRGSAAYERFRTGKTRYFSYVFRKDAA